MHGREHRAASTASPERSGVRLERLGARSEGSRDARERARAARERSRARAGGPPERSEPPTTDAGVPGETRPRPPPPVQRDTEGSHRAKWRPWRADRSCRVGFSTVALGEKRKHARPVQRSRVGFGTGHHRKCASRSGFGPVQVSSAESNILLGGYPPRPGLRAPAPLGHPRERWRSLGGGRGVGPSTL